MSDDIIVEDKVVNIRGGSYKVTGIFIDLEDGTVTATTRGGAPGQMSYERKYRTALQVSYSPAKLETARRAFLDEAEAIPDISVN